MSASRHLAFAVVFVLPSADEMDTNRLCTSNCETTIDFGLEVLGSAVADVVDPDQQHCCFGQLEFSLPSGQLISDFSETVEE